MKTATARQQEILDGITSWIRDNGTPPTIRELCKVFGIRSKNGIACHVKALMKKGLLRRGEFKQARSLLPTVNEFCPCCGKRK